MQAVKRQRHKLFIFSRLPLASRILFVSARSKSVKAMNPSAKFDILMFVNVWNLNMLRYSNNIMKKGFRFALNPILLLVLLAPSISRAAPEATLPEGTRITLQVDKNLSTRTNREGDSFTTVVTAPVNLGNRMIIPKGTVVNCNISRIVRPGKFQGKAQMNFRFQSIDIPGHRQLDIMATLVKVESQGKIRVRSEGSVETDSSAAKTAGKILAPAAIGGGIGAIAGGSQGAEIGAGVGAMLGLTDTIFVPREKDLEIKRGFTLEIELNRPLVIPVEEVDDAVRNR
jgi:hypothetical protein